MSSDYQIHLAVKYADLYFETRSLPVMVIDMKILLASKYVDIYFGTMSLE
uniref:Uncharacterized protein n=1 Tax=Arion vulgaris TaxID=1028688 RepID=A0A0B7ALB2_9EUPU